MITALLFAVALALPAVAKEAAVPKAKLEVSGLGWLKNREQRLSLERLLGEQRGETIGANAIEDAMFLLLSALETEGYLKPVIEVEMTPESGAVQRFKFDSALVATIPRELAAKEVRFRVETGVRYVVKEAVISGLTAFPEEKARGFFKPNRALFTTGGAAAYTPSRLRGALEAVQEELRLLGYAQAEARAAETRIDDRSGDVFLKIVVEQGPRWEVAGLHFSGQEATGATLAFGPQFEHRAWTPLWQQDVRERVRQALYERGYPEMSVALSAQSAPESNGVTQVDVKAVITPGPKVTTGRVRFEGNEHTKESILRRRVPADGGDPLNPILLERARYRLARLGIFSAVDVKYEPPDGEIRAPVFVVRESPRIEANVLLGYGSYEQARAGLEVRQLNLFGLAHQSRLEVVQSMKSSRGDYSYTVPELFGETVDGIATVRVTV